MKYIKNAILAVLAVAVLQSPLFAVNSEKAPVPYRGKKFCVLEIRLDSTVNGDFVAVVVACDGSEPETIENVKSDKLDGVRPLTLKLLTAHSKAMLEDGFVAASCTPLLSPGRDGPRFSCIFQRKS